MITQFKIFEARTPMDKINFEWITPNGEVLKFKNITVYKNYDSVPMMGVSQTIRQYIKQRWKGIPFQISTESYSGGDSVRVYISPAKVEEKVYKDINSELDRVFQTADFDGSTDSYDYRKERFKVIVDGRKFSIGTKSLFVKYMPKFDTKEWEEYEEWRKVKAEAEKYNM